MSNNSMPLTVGIDEVGRGCLCGDVFAAAVTFPCGQIPSGITDSKKLAANRRLALATEIRAVAHIGIGRVSAAEIDEINILQATLLAMKRAFDALPSGHYSVLVDGNTTPDLGIETKAIVQGDLHHVEIGAASIIAKVSRDALMDQLHGEYPHYGWITNKGYGTPEHLEGIRIHGPSPHHRMSFAPLRQASLVF